MQMQAVTRQAHWVMSGQIHFSMIESPKHDTRFGSGGVLPSWIDTGVWSMPNERYTYRGLNTDLRKILSNWPFENFTNVLLVQKVKSKIRLDNQNKFIKAKMFVIPSLHNRIFILNHFKNLSEYANLLPLCKRLTPPKLGLIDSKWKFYYVEG